MNEESSKTTQVSYPWRAVVRTAAQALIALAAAAPLVYSAITLQSPEVATGAGALILGVTGAVTRVMALPAVEAFLQRFVPWLSAAPREL